MFLAEDYTDGDEYERTVASHLPGPGCVTSPHILCAARLHVMALGERVVAPLPLADCLYMYKNTNSERHSGVDS